MTDKTERFLQLIGELVFADGNALLPHIPDEMQRKVNAFSEVSNKKVRTQNRHEKEDRNLPTGSCKVQRG